jgi:hypothetical protein
MSIAAAREQCQAFFGTLLAIKPLARQLFNDFAGLFLIRPFDPSM